jgi:Putative zinc-finger
VTPDDKIVFARAANLTCAECEEQLAELLDETLGGERKATVEAHLKACPECRALAQDARAAMAFTERSAAVELPATLVPRILAEMTTGPSRVLVQASLAERIFGRWIRPILQPRFALGLAMAALSIGMIPRLWKPESSDPAKVWTMAENRIYRTFDRAVKNYEDLALIANVESQIDELRDVDAIDNNTPDATGGGPSR